MIRIYQYHPGSGLNKHWEYRFNINKTTALLFIAGTPKIITDLTIQSFVFKEIASL